MALIVWFKNKGVLLKSLSRNEQVLILICLLINVFYLFTVDVKTNNEAEKYINASNDFLANGHFSLKYLFYGFYVLLISLLKSSYLIIGFQLILSWISTIHLFKIAQKIKANPYVVVGLFVSSYPIQVWNFALYTESVFVSALIILFSLILHQKSRLLILSFALCLVFTRPTFIVFIPAFLLLYKKYFKVSYWLYIPVIILIPLALISRLAFYAEYFSFFVSDQIICEVMLEGEISYFELITEKLRRFFLMNRNHYSFNHNLYLLATIVVTYFFAVIGLIKEKFETRIVFLGLLVTMTVFIGITCVNWNNRFIAPLLPFIFLLSGRGWQILFNQRKAVN